MLPVAGDADLQVFLFSLRRLLLGESRKAVPIMPGRAEHPGQDPKYLEKFIGDDDALEDFEVEPDVFYGVRPPAPTSSRISLSVHARTFKFCGIGEPVAVRVHRCVCTDACGAHRLTDREW